MPASYNKTLRVIAYHNKLEFTANKENDLLMLIRKTVDQQEKVQRKKEMKDVPKKPAGASRAPLQEMGKEETEEVMEKLMNRIVANPTLISDEKLNTKIEKIFGVEAF